MTLHITQIGKHKFVCGLFWQSLSRPRELDKEAAGLARKLDFDLVVLRREYSTAQAGFAQSVPTARGTLYSLAVAVASRLARDGATYDGENQPVHNWLAAFKLADGAWAYFAVRDANFLPNGDFAGSKEEVFERLQGDYGLGGWNMVIGDAELQDYGFHNFSEMRIEDLLGPAGQVKVQKAWALRQLNRRVSRTVLVAAAGCAALAVLAGALGWQQYQAKLQRERQAQEAELLRQMALQRGGGAALPHPWIAQPLPMEVAAACSRQFVHLTAGGWSLLDYVCTPGAARYAWTRQESTVDFLLAQVPDAVVDLSGNGATYAAPLPLAGGGDEPLLPFAALWPAIQSRLQLLQLGTTLVKRARPVPAAPPPGAPAGPPGGTAAQDWDTYSYAIHAISMSPLEVAAILSQPGIRLEKLTYRAGQWSIEGVIYAK